MKTLLLALAAVLSFGSFGCAAASTSSHAARPVSIDGESPLTVRAEAGSVWTSKRAWAEPKRVWAMPARGPVEGLAVQALPHGEGHVITFVQGGIAWRGELDADRAARGPLLPIVGAHDANGATSAR